MSLKQLFREMSHREYLMWIMFLGEELDNPNKTEQYLMQIALEIRSGEVKNPRKLKLSDFKLVYDNKKDMPESKLTKQQRTAISKATWRSRLGIGGKK